MLRFRVGQAWKREEPGPGGPRDAFALEVDGVNVLPGANDEPLVRVVSDLVDSLASMVVDGERAGQVSLEDVHLELCLWRTEGQTIALSVIDLSHPPRLLRGPLTFELPELVEAASRCARAFLKEVEGHRSGVELELVTLERRLKRLGSATIDDLAPARAEPWSAVRSAASGLGFALRDDEGRTQAWSRKTRAGLTPLLFDGELTTPSGEQVKGLPLLAMMGLTRAASQGEGSAALRAAPDEVFRAGLDLCLALRSRNPALGANPYVEALQLRCTEGLMALRQPLPDTSQLQVALPRATPGLPLAPVGQLRRVRLQPGWSRPVALGEDGGRLQLGKQLVVAHSAHAVHALTRKGREAFRHLAPRGVAVDAEGHALCASQERLVAWDEDERARWLRDHDGVHLGPTLWVRGQVWVAPQGRRGATGFDALTGRELWRFEPARTQAAHLAVAPGRVLVGTDGGSLFGLDVADGQIRFRVNASLPVVQAPLVVRRRALVVLNRGEHCAVFLCDALAAGGERPAGSIVWTRELMLATPCPPVAGRSRFFVGGARDGRAVIVSLGKGGQVLWERPVPCDARTLRLTATPSGLIVTDARGAAAHLLLDGTPGWVLGGLGDQLHHPIAPALARHVLIVPGPVTRVVDPAGGRVLAELETSAHLLDLVADARLNLFVLRAPGTLEHWSPRTALAVL